MAQITLNVNGKRETVDVSPDTPLLWVLRDSLGLTGTKYGCGMALCGACTVHLDGQAVRSCTTPVSAAPGPGATTLEGHPLPVRDLPAHPAGRPAGGRPAMSGLTRRTLFKATLGAGLVVAVRPSWA